MTPHSRMPLASLGARPGAGEGRRVRPCNRANRRDPVIRHDLGFARHAVAAVTTHDLGFARRDGRRGLPLPLDLGFARRTDPGRRGMSGGDVITVTTVATPRSVAIVASLVAAASIA